MKVLLVNFVDAFLHVIDVISDLKIGTLHQVLKTREHRHDLTLNIVLNTFFEVVEHLTHLIASIVYNSNQVHHANIRLNLLVDIFAHIVALHLFPDPAPLLVHFCQTLFHPSFTIQITDPFIDRLQHLLHINLIIKSILFDNRD